MYCVLDTTYKKPNLEWLISQIQESKDVTFQMRHVKKAKDN